MFKYMGRKNLQTGNIEKDSIKSSDALSLQNIDKCDIQKEPEFQFRSANFLAHISCLLKFQSLAVIAEESITQRRT